MFLAVGVLRSDLANLRSKVRNIAHSAGQETGISGPWWPTHKTRLCPVHSSPGSFIVGNHQPLWI